MHEHTPAVTILPDLTGEDYLSTLARIHEIVAPQTYLEIGCFYGASLTLARCDSIAIGPDLTKCPNVMQGKPTCLQFQMTSDQLQPCCSASRSI
jgi:hypothetical protein